MHEFCCDVNALTLGVGKNCVDELLQGGLRCGQVTEMTGVSTSGKTQVRAKGDSRTTLSHSRSESCTMRRGALL